MVFHPKNNASILCLRPQDNVLDVIRKLPGVIKEIDEDGGERVGISQYLRKLRVDLQLESTTLKSLAHRLHRTIDHLPSRDLRKMESEFLSFDPGEQKEIMNNTAETLIFLRNKNEKITDSIVVELRQ